LHRQISSRAGARQLSSRAGAYRGPRAAAQEKHEGKLGEAWAGALAGAGLATADVTAGLGAPLAAKDAAEVTCVKKAAFLAGSAMQKFFVQELERALPAPAPGPAVHLAFRAGQ
jgi:Xaa-Pro aminopeptidase